MVDLSVFGKIQSVSDLQRQKQALAAKQRQMAVGNQPAAIQIAREIERRKQAGDIEGAQLLFQTAKLLDKGMLPTFGQTAAMQPGVAPERGGMMPEQVQQLKELYGEEAQQGVATMPGYNEQLAARQAMMRGAGKRAEQQVNLQYEPAIKSATVEAEQTQKRQQERIGTLEESESILPQLMSTVDQLSELGKKATYTTAGRGIDILKRETGQPVGEGAVARKQYISLVDNQILPLLRQTFGAQFTQKEGESLKATLGDPDASPEEKDAVLRSFINQKIQTIQTQRRMAAQPVEITRQPQTGNNLKAKYGLE